MSAFFQAAAGGVGGGVRPGSDPARGGTRAPSSSSDPSASEAERRERAAAASTGNPFAHLLLALAGGQESLSDPTGSEGAGEAPEGMGRYPDQDPRGGAEGGLEVGVGPEPQVGTGTLVALRAPLTAAGAAAVGEAEASGSLRDPSETPALRHTEGVHPELIRRVERVVERMWVEHGHRVEVVEGHRSQSRQDRLYAQGRTAPGAVVTWTRDSAHTRGQAMDVIIDGGWDNLDAFRTLQEVAGEEGIRTLGMRDPGHLELPRGVAGGSGGGSTHTHAHAPGHAHGAPGAGRAGEGRTVTPLGDLRPVVLEAPVAGGSGFRGVARVARVAQVAQVARPGHHGPLPGGVSPGGALPGIASSSAFGAAGAAAAAGEPGAPGVMQGPASQAPGGIASIPELLPRVLAGLPTPVLGVTPVGIPGTHGSGVNGGAGQGAGGGGGEAGSQGEGRGDAGGSALAEGTEGEGASRTLTEGLRGMSPGERDRLLERLLQGRSRTSGEAAGLSGPGGAPTMAGGALNPVAGPGAPGALGSSTFLRAEQVRALQASAGPSGNLSVSLDNVDGAGTDLRLGMRGNSVSARIDAADPLQARALRLRLGELRNSLAERGLEPDRLGVRWSGAEPSTAREAERGMGSGGQGDPDTSQDDGRSGRDDRRQGRVPEREDTGSGDFARHFREEGR